MSYDLYAFPDTYAMGCHMLLEESEVNYRVIDVSQFDQLENPVRQNKVSDFHEVSPHQKVPALRLHNGTGLCESGAIALYLGDTLCDGKFSVPHESDQRAEYLQWLFYLSSTVQPEVMLQFHPENYFDDSSTQKQLQQASLNRLDKIWPVLEARYNSSTWMFGKHPTAVDFSVATVLMWPEPFSGTIDDYPALAKMLETLKQRPACHRVLDWHLGKTSATGKPAI